MQEASNEHLIQTKVERGLGKFKLDWYKSFSPYDIKVEFFWINYPACIKPLCIMSSSEETLRPTGMISWIFVQVWIEASM